MHLSFYLTRVIAALAIGIAVSYLTTPLSIKLAYKFDIIDNLADFDKNEEVDVFRLNPVYLKDLLL